MVCIGGVCLGNIWQILLAIFLIFRVWSTYKEGQLMGSSKVDAWKGPENAAKRQLAEQCKLVAPTESITNLNGLKAVIERLANNGPSFLRKDQPRHFLIKFSANWCQPCRNVAPFVDLLRYCYKFALITVDIDSADMELKKHAEAIPTFILLSLEPNATPVVGRDWLGLSVVSKIQSGSSAAIEGLLAHSCASQERTTGGNTIA